MKKSVLILLCLMISGLAFTQACYSPNMNAGKTEFNKGNYQEAINFFEIAKECDDKSGNGQADNWIEKCKNKQKEQCFETYLEEGKDFLQKKEFDAARLSFAKARNCGATHLNSQLLAFENKLPEKIIRDHGILNNNKLWLQQEFEYLKIKKGDEGCYVYGKNKNGNFSSSIVPWQYFHEGYLAVCNINTKKIGFCNREGFLIIPCVYDRVNYFINGKCIVGFREKINGRLKNKIGIIDANNNKIVDFKYTWIIPINESLYETMIYKAHEENKRSEIRHGLVKPTGEVILECNYWRGHHGINETKDFLIFNNRNQTLLISQSGQILQKTNQTLYFRSRTPNQQGLYYIYNNKVESRIDKFGNTVVPFYADIKFYNDSLYIIKKDRVYALFNRNKQKIVSSNYYKEISNGYGSNREHYLIEVKNQGGKYGMINLNGEEVIPCIYDNISLFKKGKAEVKKGLRTFYIDINGNKVE